MGMGKEPPGLILHLISRLGVGGVENQLFQVTRRYDRSLLSPMVCSIRGKGEIGSEIEEAGTEVIALGRKKVHQFDPMLVLQISRLLRQRRVRILRTHQYEAGLYGRLAALLAGTPVIVSSFHNIYRRRKWHRERINHILARCTDRIIAVSECVKSDILRYDSIAAEKVQVIYNGIDPAQFRGEARTEETKAALGIPRHSRIVGTIGRMTPQKDHATLLEAFANLPKKRDLKLLIVGDGPLRGALQKRAEELGIGNDVHLVGFRRDVFSVLQMMEVFVFPSLWEGMPSAIVEAMAAERPVVASDIPPIREIVPSSTLGILVRPKDEDSLRRGIGLILEDRGLAGEMGKRAREYALSRFPIQKAVRQYQDLFAEIEDSKFRPT